MKGVLCLVLLTVLACSERIPYATGREDEVFVIIDRGTWDGLQELLKATFEKERRIVQWERIFSLQRVDPDEFPRYRARKNLLIVGRVAGQRTSELIQELLPAASMEKVVEKGGGVFAIENPYREGQIAFVIAGMDTDAIRETIEKSSDSLFEILWARVKERIKERALHRLNRRLIEMIEEKYGWSLKLPQQYRLSKEEENVVRFTRHYPDRLVSVYWEEGGELTQSSCLEKRAWLGKAFFDGDTLLPEMTSVRDAELDGARAVRIDGVWQNEGQVMGGPFISFCIRAPVVNRNYLIDGLLFAPGKKKWIYLAELEAIVESFQLE